MHVFVFHVLFLCFRVTFCTGKHKNMHIFMYFSFNAYFSLNDIISENGLAEDLKSCYWLYTNFLHSSQLSAMVRTKSSLLAGLGSRTLKIATVVDA